MKRSYLALLAFSALFMTACSDFLDRPQQTKLTDDIYWRNDEELRLHANDYYPNYFVGYNSGWGSAWAPQNGLNFSDDQAVAGKQSTFENSVPSSRESTATSNSWLSQYVGATWNFAYVRKANIFINRVQTIAKNYVSEECYNHWLGVAEFFKAYEYCRLVTSFGDVPYFETEVADNDKATLYKDRTPRGEVMDNVYDLLKDAIEKVRVDDGANYINKYVVAGFTSRFMLFEGTWQYYHNLDKARAKKYLELAESAARLVMDSGKYAIATDFHTLFGSDDLAGNKECLMYRHYVLGQATHFVASYSNTRESQSPAPNLAFAKSFLNNDGTVSTATDADLTIENFVKNRDPRYEATMMDDYSTHSGTLFYQTKFIDRHGCSDHEKKMEAKYESNTNTNDAPVFRYAEVLLNWIEAKAVLAEMGSGSVTQADIDKSINVLRDRPLDKVAKDRGVKQTPHMSLAKITADFAPDRDKGQSSISGDYEVSPLMWEIRRERHMELAFEHSRLLDIKRWKKLHYMDNNLYPDTMLGPWVDMQKSVPSYLAPDSKTGKFTNWKVKKADGTIVTYDGTNADAMVGYFIPRNAVARDAFSDRSYLAPIGKAQIDNYAENGFTLTQTKGW